MGVDASYLYGYGAEISELEWDIDYLKEKYKDMMDQKVDDRYSWRPTWKEFIENLESALQEEEDVSECLEDINNLLSIDYNHDVYLTFNHNHIAKLYPEAMLKDMGEVSKLYAKQLGIKNVEVIDWIEFGYFS